MTGLAVAIVLGLQVVTPTLRADPFSIPSADGYLIQGEADRPVGEPRGVVVLVAGTGVFTRDVSFGRSGTPRDFIFRDLAQRMTERGLTVVRFDRRGARYGVPREERTDRVAAPTATPETLSQDVETIYEWVRSDRGLNARCVVLFGHSEGAVHIAAMAERGAPEPALFIGMGAPMESKASVVRWQSVDRDADSLIMMDADRDGVVTNAEVRANWLRTPVGVYDDLDFFLSPDGHWTSEAVARLRADQAAKFASEAADLANHADADPYPDADRPEASWAWWKSWFTDDTPLSVRFAHWRSPMILHYGDLDSQVREDRQRAAVAGALPDAQVTFVSHPDRGHSLGVDWLLGPIDEAAADQISDEAATACAGEGLT